MEQVNSYGLRVFRNLNYTNAGIDHIRHIQQRGGKVWVKTVGDRKEVWIDWNLYLHMPQRHTITFSVEFTDREILYSQEVARFVSRYI